MMWDTLVPPAPEQAARSRAEGWWRDETLLTDLARAAERFPARPAVIAYENGALARALTYAQLARMVARFAGALAGLGVGRGDVVVLYLPPATITLMEVVQRVAPASAITEAVSWAGSGVVLGMTAGSLAGGWGVQHLGIGHIYAVPAAFGALALLVTGVGYRILRPACQAGAGPPSTAVSGG